MPKGAGVGYESIVYFVMLFLLIRIGILHGRRIPLIFIGLLVIGRFTLPALLGSSAFPFFAIGLTIVLALIDRLKGVRWHSM